MQQMLRVQMIGLAIVAAVAMSAIAAGSASAAHEWLINGASLASPVKIHSLALLLLSDTTAPGGETKIHCHYYDTGTVGPGALDLVEKITAELLGTNDKIHCKFDKSGACESSSLLLFLAVNLPWHTELYLEGTEVRDMVVSDGAGEPGWKVTCKAPLLGIITDECKQSLGSVFPTNVASGVETVFEQNTQFPNCKVGAEAVRNGAGITRGFDLIESPSAGEPLTFM